MDNENINTSISSSLHLSGRATSSTAAVIHHILASKFSFPDTSGAHLPISTTLNIPRRALICFITKTRLSLSFFSLVGPQATHYLLFPKSTPVNHSSALAFKDHEQHFLDTELAYNTLIGPFDHNPLPHPLVCSPLQTVLKQDSDMCRVVMDLSLPPCASVNNGVV